MFDLGRDRETGQVFISVSIIMSEEVSICNCVYLSGVALDTR